MVAGVEGDTGQDRGLGGGVEALDVGGRVGLGVTERGRLVQRLAVAGPGRVHLVEDEVGGAVDDAEHPVDLVAGQGLAQRPYQRDRARDGGLVIQVRTVGLGRRVQRRAVRRDQRLVGGHHAGAVLESGGDERTGRLDTADDLDHDINVAAFDERGRIGGDQVGRDALAHLVGAADGDPGEFHGRTDAGGEVVGVRRHDARHL